MHALRSLAAGLLCLLGLVACEGTRARAERRALAANPADLRREAAILYKNALPRGGAGFTIVSEEQWLPTLRALQPTQIKVYRDGLALVVERRADDESGLYIIPEGMTHDPAASPRANFRELREGLYWYYFGRPE